MNGRLPEAIKGMENQEKGVSRQDLRGHIRLAWSRGA